VTDLAQRDGASVAVVFEEHFARLMPADWEVAGRWCLTKGRITNAAPCVTWYAAPDAFDEIRASLDAFEASLPSSVVTAEASGLLELDLDVDAG
jgi:hypothetical protein